MGQPKRKPKPEPKRIVTVKVAPEKLQAIFPRPEPLSVFNPNAATPPSPTLQRSRHARLTGSFVGSALASSSLFADAKTNGSANGNGSAGKQQTASILSTSPTVEQKLQLHYLLPRDPVMAEKDNQKQPAASSAATGPANGEGGVPFYESQRKHLQKLLERKRKLTESLVSQLSPSM